MNRTIKQKPPEKAAPGAGEECVHGSFEITVSEDRMRAYITLFPSRGSGTPLAVETVKKKLGAMKIIFGINEEVLKRLIGTVEKTKDEKKGVIIAQGFLPEEGKEGGIKYFFKEHKGDEHEGGLPDFGNKGSEERVLVRIGYARKGDLVASVVKGVSGKDGKDVFGKPVPAPKVNESKLLAGVNIRADKGTVYIMGVDGIVEVYREQSGVHTVSGRVYRDGRFELEVPDGEMEVLLTVFPSQGGAKPVDPEMVFQECRDRGITAHVDEAKVREAVERAEKDQTPREKVLIAAGERPVHGSDGSIQYHVRFATGSKLKALEDGSVDYKEHDLFTSVEKGTLIAELTPAGEEQKSGKTVKGKVVEARRGREVELSPGNNIRVEEEGEKSRFISAIDGCLFCDGKMLSVEPVMFIESDVGPATGNVHFNGVVEIKGDVLDGFRVFGKKGLTIWGNVGSAVVTSEESIKVHNGVIGKGSGDISAGKDISVKFAENARLTAGGDIVVHRAAMNCIMLAGGKIIAVKEKGHLVGGELKARLGVIAKILGNDSEHRMDVYAGSDFFVERKLLEVRERLVECGSEIKTLDLSMEKAVRGGRKPDQLPERLRNHYKETQDKKAALLLELEGLKRVENESLQKLEEVFDAEVLVQETLFRGVRIHFCKSVYEPDGTRTKVKVNYDKDQWRIDIGRM